ncbi:MAG: 1-deoxy-D-xylulose-5-phosphate synthase [Defluviitaleaceae bacterium]|nr:1-deoxy-D-xylulose-5-phosphate synthase [Defluviitaleaceae bacterium]
MKILNKVNSPQDLKRLPRKYLPHLCADIRRFLIQSVSKTGGHLASNLGVVELTVALHTVFNSPRDIIVWDVGHQTYVHKILTGRKALFAKLRKLGGLSGFPKARESSHDHFDTGHSSTSVSAAVGYAKARDLDGAAHNVIAVTGDGSMTGGLVFEGLNDGGRLNSNLIVVLNDNQMSISENVGAISKTLNLMRSDPRYQDLKADVKDILTRTPLLGETLARAVEKTKDTIRSVLVPGQIFEEMGFTYIGPVDGHNLDDLISVLGKVKNITKPVLVHVHTVKGKGYSFAEANPSKFHGVESFDVETGRPLSVRSESYSDVFGEALTQIARENPNVVAVTAAMEDGTGLASFANEFPRRCFDVGIAEAHAVTFCAGLAKAGKLPVFAVYSSFLQRSYDQIMHDVCIQGANVVLAIDRAGVVGADGETHQGLFDLSYLSHMPGMTVLAPADKPELGAMLRFAIELGGPVAIRYPRGEAKTHLHEANPIELGKSEWITRGNADAEDGIPKIAVIAVGTMLHTANNSVGKLTQYHCKGGTLSPAIINARSVKPLDVEMISDVAKFADFIYILEDNVFSGGYAASFAAYAARNGIALPRFHSFSFPDEFVVQGSPEELYRKYGLDADSVAAKILNDVEKYA